MPVKPEVEPQHVQVQHILIGFAGSRTSVTMIGRPPAQPRSSRWDCELAGPPVQRNSQSLTHEVV